MRDATRRWEYEEIPIVKIKIEKALMGIPLAAKLKLKRISRYEIYPRSLQNYARFERTFRTMLENIVEDISSCFLIIECRNLLQT